MKKNGAILLALLIAFTLTGCGPANDPTSSAPSPSPASDPLAVFAPVTSPDVTGTTPDPAGGEFGLDGLEEEGGMGDLSGNVDDSDDDPFTDDDFSTLDGTDATTSPVGTTTPAPDAAPVVEVKPADYVLETYTDNDLLLSIDYPTHWTVEPSDTSSSIRFVEPVASGTTPMRLTLTVRTYEEEKLTTNDQKKLFQDYVNNLKSDYGAFKIGKQSNKTSFINRRSLSVTYQAKQDGANINGYVIMASIPTSKQVVALHFTAPQAKFKAANTFFKKILYSVAVVKPAATT